MFEVHQMRKIARELEKHFEGRKANLSMIGKGWKIAKGIYALNTWEEDHEITFSKRYNQYHLDINLELENSMVSIRVTRVKFFSNKLGRPYKTSSEYLSWSVTRSEKDISSSRQELEERFNQLKQYLLGQ